MATASVRLFTAGLQTEAEWPKWFYQDWSGELQGPFDASTMIRWYSDNQLPLDLKLVGIHPQDCGTPPTNFAQFQTLQKLMDNAEAGMQYTPLRMMKGAASEEGPATPQVAVPPKGSRVAAAPAGNIMLPQHVGGSVSAALAHQLAGLTLPAAAGGTDNRSDVSRAVDQRLAAGMPALTAQQLHMQGQGLLQQLQAQQQQRQQQQTPPNQQRGGSAPRQLPPQQQQQPQPARNGSTARPAGSATSSLHEQHMQHMQQMQQAAAAAAAAATAGDAAAAPEMLPGSEAWNNALSKLISREGFTGKDADIKWRVILASGDRIGPFSSDQMLEWLLRGSPPKGINKQQANQTAANPAALQLCGILSCDYNAQRLPGAKFFKPLGQLLPAVAGGLVYEAVNKHDLQRGLPKPNWNEPGAAGAAPAGAVGGVAGLPGAKAASAGGKAGKGGKAGAGGSNSRGGSAGRGANQQQMGNNNSRPRSGAAGLAGAAAASAAVAGLDGTAVPAPKSTFQHPMALRQQQRQQQQQDEALSAAAAAASEALGGPRNQQQMGRGPSTVSPGGPGVQAGKGFDKAQAAFGSRPNSISGGSASRGILMAANSMGGVAAAAQQQQQQPGYGQAAATQAAVLAATGQLNQAGLATLRQQQQLQMQMHGLSVGTPSAANAAAYMQGAAQGMPQAMWLKQQQQQPQQAGLPNQAVAGMFAAQQSLLGYQMQAGYAAFNQTAAAQAGAAAAGEDASQGAGASGLLPNGALPRTSSTGSNAVQQGQDAARVGHALAAGAQGQMAAFQQQQQQQQPVAAGNGGPMDWQQQQQQQAGDQQGAMPGQQLQPLTPQHMQAAAMLFLQHEQHQQMTGNREVVRWWVQRSERAFSGPFTGMQMYQAYLQPSAMRFSDTTCIAAMTGGSSSRDMPAARAFVPLGALLEAAMQGYCLVPCTNKDSVQQAGPAGGNLPTVRHATTGAVVQLQQVVPSMQQQQQQLQQQQAFATAAQQPQQPQRPSADGSYSAGAGMEAAKQQHRRGTGLMHAGASSAPTAVLGSRGGSAGVPPSPSKHRAAALAGAPQQAGVAAAQVPGAAAQGTQFVATPGGGLVAIPAGATAATMLPGGTMMPAGGAGMGGVMTAQGVPMVAAAAPLDPISVASALFTAGNVPPPMAPLWFVLNPPTEPHTPPKAQGPYEPADMLTMYREQRIGPGSLVCATHRPVPGQPQTQPPPNAFQPLHALLATTSNDLICQQVNAAAAAAAMGGHMGPMVPAAALMQAGQMGQMGQMPIMIQVPVSGGQGGAAMAVAVPAGMQMQMQQLHQMQMQGMQPGGAVAMGPYMQQGGAAVPQHMQGAAQQQQQQQQPSGTDSRSHSNPAVAHAGAAAQQQQDPQPAQRSGPVPTRVDTWGSLDAHERAPTNSSSSQLQQQHHMQQMTAGAQAVEAVLASRRTSADSHHSQNTAHGPGGMMGMGTLWVQQQQQQQQHHHQSGPRSSNSSSYGQYPQQQQQHHHPQMLVRRTSSGSSRSNANSGPASNGADAAAAAVAAALANAGNVSAAMVAAGAGGYGVHMQQQQQQQLQSTLLGGMSPSTAMTGIPEHQPQLLEQPQAHPQLEQLKQAVAAVTPSPTPSAEGSTAASEGKAATAAATPASAAGSEASSQSAAESQ